MSTARRAPGVARNTLYNLVGSLLPIVVTLVTVPIYLRLIGEARYGVLAIVWLIFGYFSIFDMGLSRATSNQTAKLRDGKAEDRQAVFWTALTMNAAFGVLGAVLLWLVGGLLLEDVIKMPLELRSEVLAVLPWVVFAVPIITISGVLAGTLEGNEHFLTINFIRVAGSVLFAVIPLTVALFNGPSLTWLIPAAVLTRVVFTLPLLIAALRTLPHAGWVKPSRHWGRSLLHYGAWVMVTNVVGPILEAADRLLVGAALGVTAVTAYTIPFNLADRLRVIPLSLSNTLFPHLSAKTGEQATQTAQISLRLLGKVMTLVVGVGILGVHFFLSLWINPAFAAKSAPVGQIMLLGIWINGLAFIPFSLLQSQGRPDLVARFHVLELLPFLGILWLGMQWFGLLGAALAWTLRVTVDAGILLKFARLAPTAVTDLWPAPLALTGMWTLAVLLADSSPWKWLLGSLLMLAWLSWTWRSEPLLRDKLASKFPRLRHLLVEKIP